MVGSSRMSRSGSWISEQHSESFCFMPPESLPAGRSGNGSRPVARSSRSMRAARSAADWPNRRPKKSMFSSDRERRIEIAARGPAACRRCAAMTASRCAREAMSPPSVRMRSGLQAAHAGDQREQRRLADAVRPDEAPWRCPAEWTGEMSASAGHLAVAMGDAARPRRRTAQLGDIGQTGQRAQARARPRSAATWT